MVLKWRALIHCDGAHVVAAVGQQVEDERNRTCLKTLIWSV